MKTIGLITFARSEYSSLLPILQAIQADSELDYHLTVSGSHLSPHFGYTIKDIESDGFHIDSRIEMMLASDQPEGIGKSIALGLAGFSQEYARYKPDILLAIGDRTELLAVVIAALLYDIPVAHISGGDITEGAIDNQVRHAVSKMSHLHFVAMKAHANRLIQMGEEPWRIFVTGDPALDIIQQINLLSLNELEESLQMTLIPPIILVTYHPVTLDLKDSSMDVEGKINELLRALEGIKGTFIFTQPNADANNQIILDRIKTFTEVRKNAKIFSSLGQIRYYSLLSHADVMIGNSSSGIWEAPSFELPVVNIGNRQRGRFQSPNVINANMNAEKISDAIQSALTNEFRNSLQNLENPYGDGQSAFRIIDQLKQLDFDQLLLKRFVDFTHIKES